NGDVEAAVAQMSKLAADARAAKHQMDSAAKIAQPLREIPPARHESVPAGASTPQQLDVLPATQAVKVQIDNFSFSPETLTVAPGTKVTWVNRDDIPHTATSADKPRMFNSGALDTDQEFSFVFERPGTYRYFCAVHPKMTGQIIVK